jgi:hypothetical protein
MKKYIQQYLSEYYYIETSEIGNDGIYYKLNDNKWRTPHNGKRLISEIVTIFGLEEEESKTIIIEWAVSLKPDLDLEFYWKNEVDLIFPAVARVAAATLGMDLVSVQPMSAPRGELMFLDFNYGDGDDVVVSGNTGRRGPVNRNGRVYNEEIVRQSWGNIAQLYENQKNYIVGVSSRKKKEE